MLGLVEVLEAKKVLNSVVGSETEKALRSADEKDSTKVKKTAEALDKM